MVAPRAKLTEWRTQLSSLSASACRFAHHTEEGDLPLCPVSIQNTRHGCAHGMHYVLQQVIDDMSAQGFLLRGEKEALTLRVNDGRHRLVHEQDFVIALQPIDREQEEAIFRAQERVVAQRAAMTTALLQLVSAADEETTDIASEENR